MTTFTKPPDSCARGTRIGNSLQKLELASLQNSMTRFSAFARKLRILFQRPEFPGQPVTHGAQSQVAQTKSQAARAKWQVARGKSQAARAKCTLSSTKSAVVRAKLQVGTDEVAGCTDDV